MFNLSGILKKDWQNPYKPDITIFLIAIPFIAAFNYHLTYSNIRFNWFLALTFSIDTIQGYMAWWAVRYLILVFDKKMPYHSGQSKRIVFQVITTTLVGLFVISITTELVAFLVLHKHASIKFYKYDLLIIAIWFLVINGIYIGLHYYHKLQELSTKPAKEYEPEVEGLIAKFGKQDIKVHFKDIAGFYVDGDYVAGYCTTGKKYYFSQSLDKIEQSVPHNTFFRLNRQFLLHRQVITGFKRSENGKIIVLLESVNNSLPSEIAVSRTKAPAFKTWFR